MNLNIKNITKEQLLAEITTALKNTSLAFAWFIGGFVLAAAVFGDGYAWHFILCAAVPLLWFKAPTRIRAWLFALGYYLGAAHDVPAGSAVFFGFEAPVLGIVLWLTASLTLSLPWAVFWTKFNLAADGTPIGYKEAIFKKAFRLSLALLFVTIPPLGAWGWANPIMGFAWLPFFTGTGFIGIILGILITSALGDLLIRLKTQPFGKRLVYGALVVTVFIMLFMFGHSPSKEAFNKMTYDLLGIRTIYTEEGKPYSGSERNYGAEQLNAYLIKHVKVTDKDKIIILPETVAGNIDDKKSEMITRFIRSTKRDDLTIYIGGQKIHDNGSYENGMYCYTAAGYVIGANYIQRYPVPVSMWLPFVTNGTCIADWFSQRNIRIGDKKAACLICFEHVLAMPVLLSFATFDKPDMILATANKWWSKGTGIPAIQDQSVLSWARLFGVPVITAENR